MFTNVFGFTADKLCSLTLQIIEGLLQDMVNQYNLANTVYILNHYTAGVILFGEREQIRRQSLTKVCMFVWWWWWGGAFSNVRGGEMLMWLCSFLCHNEYSSFKRDFHIVLFLCYRSSSMAIKPLSPSSMSEIYTGSFW